MLNVGYEGFDYKINSIDVSCDSFKFEESEASATYSLKEQRKRIRDWAKSNLVGKSLYLPGQDITVNFSSGGIKEAINQPHKYIIQKNELIKNIEELIVNADFVKSENDRTGDENYIFHYFRVLINEEDSFIVLKEIKKERKIIFYSIVDKIKK
jgi:hypothetical protein